MKNSTLVDPWSFATIYVVPYEYSAPLSTATGFVVRDVNSRHYLVTNYHVVSGKHPTTKKALDKGGHLPDRLLLPLLRKSDVGVRLLWTPVVLPLFDENYHPLWIEHPTLGSALDVVLLPFHPPPYVSCVPVETSVAEQVAVFAGSTVSIVGFPHGLSGPALTAIWKTGAIASEPELPVDGEDYFWIDANTRAGMSGAPVIARRLGSFLTTDGTVAIATNPVDRLLGVYAGRALDATDMTLGRVWRWRGILEILRAAESNSSIAVAPLGTLGHYLESPVPTITNAHTTITLPGPISPISTQVTVSALLSQVATHDERFGASLERLQLAARIVAACEQSPAGGEIELPLEAMGVLAECLRKPAGWGYPKGGYQIVSLIERTIGKLEAAMGTR